MDLGGFVDFGEGGLQATDIGLGGIEDNGNGLTVEVANQIFDATLKGDVLLNLGDTTLAMQVDIEHHRFACVFRPQGYTQ